MVVVHYAFGKSGSKNTVQLIGTSHSSSTPSLISSDLDLCQTVGYGNYVPYTSSGRVMVMTLGFLSILAFAGILSMAGVIASAIFDDCLVRLRFKALTHPAVAMVVWGSLYYTWMVRLFPAFLLVAC
jgi:Ion channel